MVGRVKSLMGRHALLACTRRKPKAGRCPQSPATRAVFTFLDPNASPGEQVVGEAGRSLSSFGRLAAHSTNAATASAFNMLTHHGHNRIAGIHLQRVDDALAVK